MVTVSHRGIRKVSATTEVIEGVTHDVLDHGLVAQVEGSNPTAAREAAQLSVDPAACHLFDEAGLAVPHLQQHSLAT